MSHLEVNNMDKSHEKMDTSCDTSHDDKARGSHLTKDLEELQTYLRDEYLQHYLGVRLLPVLPENHGQKRTVDELYVPVQKKLKRFKAGRTFKRQKASVKVLDDILHNRRSIQNIFLTAEAGMGKTILCRKILSTWCKILPKEFTDNISKVPIPSFEHVHDNRKPHKIDEDSEDVSKSTLKNFPYIFYVSLRNVHTEETVEEMIVNQLLEGKYVEAFKHIVETQPEKCMYIIDGLDEWNPKHTTKRIPERDHKCISLFTTRPWKMTELQRESEDVDVEIKLTGFNDRLSDRLVNIIIENMNKQSNMKTIEQFRSECNTGLFSRNPMLLKFLVCVWHNSGKSNTSLTELYFDIVEWNLQEVLQQQSLSGIDTDTINRKLPRVMHSRQACQQFSTLLKKMTEICFKYLGRPFDFTDADLATHGLSPDEIKVCHRFGVTSYTVVESRSMEKQDMSIICIHKTFQELSAALYVAENPEMLQTLFEDYQFDALSFVLQFISGFNSSLVGDISSHMYNIAHDKCPTELMPQSAWIQKRKQEQNRLIACINEAKAIGALECGISVPLKYVFLRSELDLTILECLDPDSVEHIFLETDESIKYVEQICNFRKLRTVAIDMVTNRRSETNCHDGNQIVGPLLETQLLLTNITVCHVVLSHSLITHLLCNIGTLTDVELVSVICKKDSNCSCVATKSTADDHASYTTGVKKIEVYDSNEVMVHITSAPSLEDARLTRIEEHELDNYISVLASSTSLRSLELCGVISKEKESGMCFVDPFNRPDNEFELERRYQQIKRRHEDTSSLAKVTIYDSVFTHSHITRLLNELSTPVDIALMDTECLPDQACGCQHQAHPEKVCAAKGIKRFELESSKGVLWHLSLAENLESLHLKNIFSEKECELAINLARASYCLKSISLCNVKLKCETFMQCIALSTDVAKSTLRHIGDDTVHIQDGQLSRSQSIYELEESLNTLDQRSMDDNVMCKLHVQIDDRLSKDSGDESDIHEDLMENKNDGSDRFDESHLLGSNNETDGLLVNKTQFDRAEGWNITKHMSPCEAWYAYDYSCKHIESLCIEYREMLNKCDLHETNALKMCQERLHKTVSLIAIGEANTCVTDMVMRRAGHQHGDLPAKRLDPALFQTELGTMAPLIYVAFDHDLEQAIRLCQFVNPKSQGTLVVLINDPASEKLFKVLSFKQTTHIRIAITCSESVQTDIDDLLERYAFDIVHSIAGSLNFLTRAAIGMKTRKRSEDKTWEELLTYAFELQQDGYSFTTTKSTLEASDVNIHLEKLEKIQPYVAMIYSNIESLYHRSKIPSKEKAILTEKTTLRSNKQTVRDVLDVDTVAECGEKNNVFHVHFQSDNEGHISQTAMSKVAEILRERGHHEYIFRSVPDSMNPLYKVGEAIGKVYRGTLGGFATDSENSLYALLSRHVAQIHVMQNESVLSLGNTVEGHILEPLEKDGTPLDIAAARIKESHVSLCETSYMDEYGHQKPCLIFDFKNSQIKNFTEFVHIWGSVSKPGLGKIDLHAAKTKEDVPFLTFTNRKRLSGNVTPFCQKGDSGSIVMGSDRDGHLYAIAMLMGEKMAKEGQEEKPLYVALPLQDGLEQLSYIHSVNMKLCDQGGK